MKIKGVFAKKIKDSRGENTIKVIISTDKGKFTTSAPSGKSKGKHEVRSYKNNVLDDILYINNKLLKKIKDIEINKFLDLNKIEKVVENKIGGNSLFCLEASILKALAKENDKELWCLLNENEKVNRFPRPVGNSIGGGLHSRGSNGKRPDFQEFLYIATGLSFKECVKINRYAYKLSRKFLKNHFKRNDEGAIETGSSNEKVLEIMNKVQDIVKYKFKAHIDIGIDVASSAFYEKSKYDYKNPPRTLNPEGQLNYIKYLIDRYSLFYVEDPFNEEDFMSFSKLNSKIKNSIIVGDDLTTTNPIRLKTAINKKSITGIIVKPNQIGSLLKVKKVMDEAKKAGIKTIISHRSGETDDDTIADFAYAWDADFIKCGVYGKEREAKLKRLIQIEKQNLHI